MVDISKCHGVDCPVRRNCYRYTSQSNPYWQSFMDFVYDKIKQTCEGFIKE